MQQVFKYLSGDKLLIAKLMEVCELSTCEEVDIGIVPALSFEEIPITPIAVSGVTLSDNEKGLLVGESFTLTSTVSPENAKNKNITWASSAPNIATVSTSGLVTAISEGSAAITVTTEDGSKTATCKITIAQTIDNLMKTSFAGCSSITFGGTTYLKPNFAFTNTSYHDVNVDKVGSTTILTGTD
ncbi:Ig-like domain-containing protein [Treponema sp.]|uniref:Ig-like domain-containing protein n=1 Tax=Treponema sp. TaxID=166 RepID=UPI003FD8C26F